MAGRIQGITVEIGGDTTKLSSALKNVNTDIKSTQAQLKDVEKLLKLDPGNTELLAQKQRLLGAAIENTKAKLETLKTAQRQVQDQFERGEITESQYNALQREIVETELSLRDLEMQAEDANRALSHISMASERVEAFGNACTTAGTKLLPLTGAILGAGTASARLAMNFEDAMAKIATIADTTEVPLKELEAAILELSNQTGISSMAIAENVYDAISAGQSTADAVNFVSHSTKLAKAGFTDAGSALDILTTILNAYGLEASEVTTVCNTLIQTQNLGKTTVNELASSMGKIIPTAKANGVALNQIAAGYAIMTANGVATAESTTYMNAMLNELGKTGTTVSDTLRQKTGQSFAELMGNGFSLSDVLQMIANSAKEQGLAFSDLWSSTEAGKSGLILLGDSADSFNNTLAQMQNSTGATDVAFEKLQTNSNTIKIAMNQLKNSSIELGSAVMSVLAPMISSLSEKISRFSTWFSGLSDGNKRMIVVIAGVVAAIGPALLIVGKIAGSISAIINLVGIIAPVLSALIPVIASVGWPILAIIAAVIAVIAIGRLLMKHWDEIKIACEVIWGAVKEFFRAVWENIKVVFQTVVEVIKTIVITYFTIYKTIILTLLTAIKVIFLAVWNGIKLVLVTVVTVIKTIIMTYFTIYKTIILTLLKAIQIVVMTVWSGIKLVITSVIKAIQTIIHTGWNTIKTVITTVITAIQTVITTVWNAVKTATVTIMNALKIILSTVWNTIKSIVTTAVNTIKTTVTTVFTAVVKGIQTAMSKVYGAVKKGFDKAVEYIKSLASSAFTWGADMVDGLVKGIQSCIGKVGEAVKSVADKITAFLHFSVPDEGPLTEYESWMPDFMSGLAKGIEQSKSMVTKAVDGVASDLIIQPQVSTGNGSMAEHTAVSQINQLLSGLQDTISSMQPQAGGTISIPVYLGGNLLDEVVVNAQSRVNLRSGGR
ncbi:phage tail tape measure protein [Anaeromicropila populeti]|uniref:Phage tail tape measure protein, TP901 family, core region n=1 Tax=Anaeromicropila populeti TaxID=37658 RepID=A0A1I6LRC8_9FIRM|nr:phage tail tape measure protein [Anaeromicropila populeti]SFS06057.1 phage tail tape measure protein, TP901 family, core region [Anaeromicropila populeti]